MVVNLQESSFEELFNRLWGELCKYHGGGINWKYAEMLVNVIMQRDIKQAQIEKAEALLARQIIARLKEFKWVQEKPLNEQYERIKKNLETIQKAIGNKVSPGTITFEDEIKKPMTEIQKELDNILRILFVATEREKTIKAFVERLEAGFKQEQKF